MRYSKCIVLPGLPVMNSSKFRDHWERRRERIRWEKEVAVAIGRDIPEKPLVHAQVTVTRCSGSREPDQDNLVQGGKYILDGLVKLGVLLDDKPAVIGRPEYRWKPAKLKHGCVVVEISEVVMRYEHVTTTQSGHKIQVELGVPDANASERDRHLAANIAEQIEKMMDEKVHHIEVWK